MLSHRRGRLKTLLITRTSFAGVGNIYADETLWESEAPPAARRSNAQARRRAPSPQGACATCWPKRSNGGAVRSTTTRARRRRLDAGPSPGVPAAGEPLRSMRATDPPDRRGRAIGTHFCSWCQRLPAEQRAAAAKTSKRARLVAGPVEVPAGRSSKAKAPRAHAVTKDARVADRAGDRTRRLDALQKAAAARRAAARVGGPA